jgi:2-polyprenyl-3-methyl-5-hydroxy-6-metoxy-1,4-benzoquinol methylase
MVEKISEGRWQQANEGELKSWSSVLGTVERALQEDAFPRHSPVLLLDKDEIQSQSICDIGGGPISILLHYKTVNSVVVDPLPIPEIFKENYSRHGLAFVPMKAEDFLSSFIGQKFDEVWIYNCLQHVQDPELILSLVHKVAPVLRISEPCNYPPNELHPHLFTPEYIWDVTDRISVSGTHTRVDYDFPYVGGKFLLK